MRRVPLVLVLVGAMLVTLAVPGGATPPTETEIENPIVFGEDPTDFTATGGVVCSEGSVETVHFKAAGGGPTGVNFQLIQKFTCDDESGEFFVKLQVRLSFETFTTTFNWNVVGGTDAYVGLHGSGRGFSTLCGPDCIIDHYRGGFHINP